jgi:hypothetical protein
LAPRFDQSITSRQSTSTSGSDGKAQTQSVEEAGKIDVRDL